MIEREKKCVSVSILCLYSFCGEMPLAYTCAGSLQFNKTILRGRLRLRLLIKDEGELTSWIVESISISAVQ